jgi:hypothetical protein
MRRLDAPGVGVARPRLKHTRAVSLLPPLHVICTVAAVSAGWLRRASASPWAMNAIVALYEGCTPRAGAGSSHAVRTVATSALHSGRINRINGM